MPRKTRRIISPPTPARAAQPLSLLIVLTAIVSFALGAGATYLVLRHSAHAPKALSTISSQPVSGAPGTPAPEISPPASLTAGLPLMQASSNLGNWYYDHKQWPQAITNYTEAINDGLDNPDIRTDLGNAYRFSGQTDQALSEYAKAQSQNPKHENSLFNQGGAYVDQGKFEKAMGIWLEYIRRFPHGQHVAESRQLITAAESALKSPIPAGSPHPSIGP